MKKLASLILALSLCMAFAVPAFAADYGVIDLGEYKLEAARVEKQTLSFMAFNWETEKDETWEETVNVISVKPGTGFVDDTGDAGFHLWYLENGIYIQLDALVVEIYGDETIDTLINRAKENVPSGEKYLFMYGVGSDGMKYFLTIGDGDAAPAQKPEVVPTSQNLTVNGEKQETEIYNIDGSNYFKLRDMAALLNGTGSQFSVAWDAANATISITTGEAYTAVGGELATGTDKSATAVESAQKLMVNGGAVDLVAYNIGGNNFFKLRELGTALGFDVDYDDATATMIVSSR